MLPLRQDLKGRALPTKTIGKVKVCTPEELLFFFKHCFSPKERKQKMILLLQLGCACRIAEACAVNINDFHKDSDYRILDMLIQKKHRRIYDKKRKVKRISGENVIVVKELPEAIALHIKAWIQQNYDKIIKADGYVFPPASWQKTPYYDPKSVIHWFSNKRKQLIKLFPDKGFDKVIGSKIYQKPKYLNKHLAQHGRYPIHLWSTHMMKRFAGTYSYLLTKDVILTKELLCHSKLATTEQYYIDAARIIEGNRKSIVINKLFNSDFYNEITEENENITAVWEEIPLKNTS